MENTEFTKELANNPLIKELIKLSIESQTTTNLFMAFITNKINSSDEEGVKFLTEFTEYHRMNRADTFKKISDTFMVNYLNKDL